MGHGCNHLDRKPWSCLQACGSGGTTAGLALGNHLGKFGWRIWAYGVCDDPQYFYDYTQELLNGMGATPEAVGEPDQAAVRCVRMVLHHHQLVAQASMCISYQLDLVH